MAKDDWRREGDIEYMHQNQPETCGYCCIANILYLHGKGKNSVIGIKKKAKEVDPNRAIPVEANELSPSAIALPGLFTPTVDRGTVGKHVAKVLTDGFNYKSQWHSSGAKQAMMRGIPIIIGVDWTGGGGHWVVVASRKGHGFFSFSRKSTYTIIDSCAGYVDIKGKQNYTPRYGGSGIVADDYISVLIV